MLKRFWLLGVLIGMALAVAKPAQAHANLYHSNPAANAVLAAPPSEIRLWFTEELEADFSSFSLRDRQGVVIETPPSQVDSSDSRQLFMQPARLPDGLYTVAWRVVSVADGHPTRGSFVFTIGEPIDGVGSQTQATESIPTDSAAIRWLNLVSFALAVGSVGFWILVWQPALGRSQPALEFRMRKLIWAGWWLMGVTAVLMLLLQISQTTGHSIFDPIQRTTLRQIVMETRFGRLWLARNLLWGIWGFILLLAKQDWRFYWNVLALGGVVLLTQSLFSHASGAQVQMAAVAVDWLHLMAAVLWLGGLVQFFNLVGPLRRDLAGTHQLAVLVGYFSNLARVAVISLVITGGYAAWLQVGTLDGLFDTQYGQTLLVKSLLLLPLLAIAGINLILTHRGLQQGQPIWAGRLQGLIGLEIALAAGVFAAVGVMTAIAPARGVMDLRKIQAAVETKPPADPIIETKTVDNLNIQLEIQPGYVGENIFLLRLIDLDGTPIENASSIRLRFESQSENLGRTELDPTHQSGGTYAITGSNLSTLGDWEIRVNIQRPNVFDTVVDFSLQVTLPPAPPLPPELGIPFSHQRTAAGVTGLLVLAVGGFIIGKNRRQWSRGENLIAVGMVMVGILVLIGSVVS